MSNRDALQIGLEWQTVQHVHCAPDIRSEQMNPTSCRTLNLVVGGERCRHECSACTRRRGPRAEDHPRGTDRQGSEPARRAGGRSPAEPSTAQVWARPRSLGAGVHRPVGAVRDFSQGDAVGAQLRQETRNGHAARERSEKEKFPHLRESYPFAAGTGRS